MNAIVNQVYEKRTKKGEPYLMGTIGNENVEFKIWNDKNYDELYNIFRTGNEVEILKAIKEDWKGNPYIVIKDAKLLKEAEIPENWKMFEEEIALIKTEEIRKFVIACLENVPDYFFAIPASSSGKYHPQLSLGNRGLVRHTKLAVKFAKQLIDTKVVSKFTEEEKDCIIAALILHDSHKNGVSGSQYTVAEHPNIAANFVMTMWEEWPTIDLTSVSLIAEGIRSHMGQWNCTKGENGTEILPTPKTEPERLIHLCDYLAATPWINVKEIENVWL